MDPLRFDRLSRLLATAPTRRTAMAGLAGLRARLLAPASDADAQARDCRPLGGVCPGAGPHLLPGHHLSGWPLPLSRPLPYLSR